MLFLFVPVFLIVTFTDILFACWMHRWHTTETDAAVAKRPATGVSPVQELDTNVNTPRSPALPLTVNGRPLTQTSATAT